MTDSGSFGYNSGSLYYEVDGSGPALTLIHAGVANLRQWDAQVPRFSRRHRVIRYDTRGFGRTTTGDVPFSNRGDLAALLDHLGVEQTAVLGTSRGGSIAVDFTLEHPERVTALITVASGLGGFDVEPPADEQAIWDEYDRRYDAKDWDWIIDTETAFWVDGPRQPADRVPPGIRDQVHAWIAESYRDHGSEEPQPDRLEPPAVHRLGEITVPTLVMVGDLDESATVESSRRLARDIPNARLELFEGVAHMVNLERPERFTQLVLEFLSDGVGPATRTQELAG
jgi:3-oxoadipate enol-lactonase